MDVDSEELDELPETDSLELLDDTEAELEEELNEAETDWLEEEDDTD